MAQIVKVLNRQSVNIKQPSMHAPLRFESYLRPMVWGGRQLGEVLGKPLPTKEAYGESWEISDHPVHRSEVAVGLRTGQSLRHLMESDAARCWGRQRPTTRFSPGW